VLVVFATQRYASQLVLPASKSRPSVLPSSHKDIARKAFERVTKNVLAVSHVQLVRALAAEARSYSTSVENLTNREREAILAVATPKETAADEDVLDGVEVGDVDECEVGEAGD